MNYHRASLLFAGIACAASLVGCKGTTRSSSVSTEDIVAFIEVTDDGYGSIVATADLQIRTSRNDDLLQLASGDRLDATLGNQTTTMNEQWSGRYEASFSRSNGEDVLVALERSRFDSATGSVGRMPDALDIGGFDGVVVSRSYDAIVIELPETDFDKSVLVSGPCVSGLSFDLGEPASDVVIDPGAIHAPDPASECDVTITVTSTRYGAPDPSLHPDSTFVLTRSRSTTFYSMP